MIESEISPIERNTIPQILKEGTSPGILFVPSIVKTPDDYLGSFVISQSRVIGVKVNSYGKLVRNRERELDSFAHLISNQFPVRKIISFSSGAGVCLDLAELLGLNGSVVVLVAPVILTEKSFSLVASMMSIFRVSDSTALRLIRSIPNPSLSELSELIMSGGRLTEPESRVQEVVLEVIKSDMGPRLIKVLERVTPTILAGESDRIFRIPQGYGYTNFVGGHSMDDAIRQLGKVILE